MDNPLKQLTDIQKTTALSLALHVLVAVLLMLTQVSLDFDRPEFTEINFVQGEEPVSRTPTPAEQPEEPTEQVRQEPPPPEPEPTQQVESSSIPVELPQRRMREEAEPEITEPPVEKLTQARAPEQRRVRQDRSEYSGPGERTPEQTAGEKVTASPQRLPASEPGVTPSQETGGPQQAQPFTIEGEAANREIVHKVIPEYPPDLQQEATVKIRFTVLPDGRVGQMIPIHKDYPTLEDLTLQALEQWRFNPLPPGAKQQPVQGIITFRYELE